jgi:hypothetical protein
VPPTPSALAVRLAATQTAPIANYGGSGDLDGDGIPAFTFTPSNAEKVAEIYYRFSISPQFQLTPDFQWITAAAAMAMPTRSRSSDCAPTSPIEEVS